jgi:hypothetical protein
VPVHARPLQLQLVFVFAFALAACASGRSSTQHGDDPCTDFQVEVEHWWSASIRAQVLGNGGELELEKRRGVVTKLDRISEDWVMMRTSTCKDHYVRGLIDAREYAARVRCFDDRLERQRTLATALTGGGSLADVDGALDLLLAAPASCVSTLDHQD